MKVKILLLGIIAAAFIAGFGYGRWYATAPEPVVAAHGEPRIISYRCSMDPAYKSDKPGRCPLCNMALEPVYARGDHGTAVEESPDSRLIHISPDKQQLIGVEYAEAQYGPVNALIRAAAKIEPDESKLYHIQSKIEGWIDDVYVTLTGALVKKNQPLLTIYSPMSLGAQYELIKHAGGGMHMAPPAPVGGKVRQNSSGAKPASEPGAPGPDSAPVQPPPQGVQGAAAASEKNEALFNSDMFRLRYMGFDDDLIMTIARTGTALYKIPIYSPVDGFVIEHGALPKQKMSPDALYTIADLSTVFVTASVFEREAAAIKVGQAATLTIPSLPGKTFKGRVAAVLPIADPVTQTLKVRAVFDNPGYTLKPGLFGDMQFGVTATRRLTVPQSAVLDSGLRQIVFVDRGEGNLETRDVHTGARFGDAVEILQGLKAGERIVISGNFLIDSESQLRSSRSHQ